MSLVLQCSKFRQVMRDALLTACPQGKDFTEPVVQLRNPLSI